MYALFPRFVTVFILLLGLTFSAHAQSSVLLGAITSSEDETKTVSSEFVEVMKNAAENGVKVIVVDTDGVPLNTVSDKANASDEDADTMSGIMKTQVSAIKFRETLFERLRSLPKSFEEVVYILRATSPTGEIFTYADVLMKSLLLFLIGYLIEQKVYLKYVKKSYLAPDIIDNPVGYTGRDLSITIGFPLLAIFGSFEHAKTIYDPA